MSGAADFILGILGLGTAGAVHVGQSISRSKKIAEMNRMSGADATGERRKMYDHVREERFNIYDGEPNCLGNTFGNIPVGPIRTLRNATGSKHIWMHRAFLTMISFWMK